MRGNEVMQNQNRFVVPPWAQAINRGDDAQIGVKRQSSGVRHTYLESGENKLPMALRSGVRTTRQWQGPVFPLKFAFVTAMRAIFVMDLNIFQAVRSNSHPHRGG
jgi:hypothetical protein